MDKLNITDDVLDKLGFTEYWDEHCTWGTRSLIFDNGVSFDIIEMCQDDCCDNGYDEGYYISQHWYFSEWYVNKTSCKAHDLFFMHEMYECIKSFYPECLDDFITKCKQANMSIYIERYLENNSQVK